jgi:hypothetical protein|tara:strand:+ start:1281 stop:1457 length:177 start_codon:yes stop_codon:yes gene_type:complete
MREWKFTYDGIRYCVTLENGVIDISQHSLPLVIDVEIEAAKKLVRELNNAILSAEGEF